MTIKEKLNQDLKKFLKTGEAFKVSVLRMLLSAFHNKELEKRAKVKKENPKATETDWQLTAEEATSLLRREVKKRKEAISQYQQGGREDLVQKEQKELELIESYLPPMASEEEIKKIVQEIITNLGPEAQNQGRVIKLALEKLGSRAEGAKVAKIVKELMS